MAERFASRRNIDFLLNEVFNVDSLVDYPYYQDHSRETLNLVIDTAWKIATDVMYPCFKEMDENPPQWIDGQVKVNPIVKDYLKECGQGGWINAHMSNEFGGQQLPNMLRFVTGFIFSAANYSLSVYPMLTAGAANLIAAFGSKEMQEAYLEKMFAGEWQGTMALTEPDVGSSLSDLTTQAIPTGEGYYLIKGKKIFISAGTHEAVDNVVHLMLARIQGAPAGVKGISLFVVPKQRITAGGGLENNDLTCDGIEHKLGYRGCPICQLTMGENGDCRGYLVGEANKGLAYMFAMMNEERINVGIGATSKTTAAYYAALEYCQQRLQGRKLSDKDPQSPQVPIIQHPDIKRMLLFQRAVAEGSLSLALQLSKYLDLIAVGEDKEKYELLVDVLVPIVKTYPSEMGILATSMAIQCLGGYGYCSDFPVGQYYRDIRIDPIHEGTTGIQGQDLLGRKVTMKKGEAYKLYLEEVNKSIEEARGIEETKTYALRLSEALKVLQKVTMSLLTLAGQGKIEDFLADATLYLEMFGIIAIAWQWLIQAIAVEKALKESPTATDINFYLGKAYTCGYFFEYELPKIEGLAHRLLSEDKLTVAIQEEYFED
ncbi:MAG: acyl-CoA dehydrogenase [Chitinophagales bacterium]